MNKATLRKIDYKKELASFYKVSPKHIGFIEIPDMQFLMIDGIGNPNDEATFGAAIEALYGMAYTIKFMLKKSIKPFDSVVMPLEALYWADDPSAFVEKRYAEWHWTLMIMQPPRVTADDFAAAKQQLKAKKDPVSLDLCRLDHYTEGKCAQIQHLGPYNEEGPTVEKLHKSIIAEGYQLTGKHHEIYLSDPRRTASEKLKTIIRMPYSTQ
ncbi:MAG: GyrI-like domain-containing protein [Gammaproteobacteria bacterium]|nr:GyrI-like domain-containing protein [Gammaproteobacteria bacterium]